ncbi:hypothetical protein UFOVP525_5 [uncultured Caudovirales phage]|uniref:Uncharacterized protein n=1 Tax=uncultured Caudovirales phage TaxID=2100421 RepID=A0A6J5MXQ6_9CAUD|nr:hypothetical protein UFOVP525_5 [uncultured Caudovirales phage]
MNADEKKEFVDMWHDSLDRLESLDITDWLRKYADLNVLDGSSQAKELMARVDAKLHIAADTIEQLTKQRDAERREYCELCAPEWGLPSPQWLAKDKGWDCYEKETT